MRNGCLTATFGTFFVLNKGTILLCWLQILKVTTGLAEHSKTTVIYVWGRSTVPFLYVGTKEPEFILHFPDTTVGQLP